MAALAAVKAFYVADWKAAQDPAHAKVADLNRFLSGPALKLFDSALATERKQGVAYRGVQDDPRLTLGSVFSSNLVYVYSCPRADSKNPATEYYVASGKPVPGSRPTKQYRRTISVLNGRAGWQVYDFQVNLEKPCPA